jgi:hypothetical protein
MCRLWRAVIAVLILGGTVTYADDDTPPPIRQFDIPNVERLGREMYEQDQEAWKATDILFAKYSRADLQAEKQQLWVVDKFPDRDVVRFVDNRDTGPVPAYDVTFFPGKNPILSAPGETALTPDELAQYNARMLAEKHVNRPCAPTYNTIALKDPEGDGWIVWAMAATTDPAAIMIGGHYRFTISTDGTTLVRSDALSVGCLTIQRPASKAGLTEQGAFVSHVVSSLPVETHVFANLTSREPLSVGGPDGRIWKIAQGDITEINMDSPDVDGFVARHYASDRELCRAIFSKVIDGSTKYVVGSDDIKVIDKTEAADSLAIASPPGAKVVSVACRRDSIVPAPNDYKVLMHGYMLTIFAQQPEKREGDLSFENGKVTLAIKQGDSLTAREQAAVNARLAVFQKALLAIH